MSDVDQCTPSLGTPRPPPSLPGVCFVATATFHMCPQVYTPSSFSVPLLPWVPAAGIMFNLYLVGSLGDIAFYFWCGVGCGGAGFRGTSHSTSGAA